MPVARSVESCHYGLEASECRNSQISMKTLSSSVPLVVAKEAPPLTDGLAHGPSEAMGKRLSLTSPNLALLGASVFSPSSTCTGEKTISSSQSQRKPWVECVAQQYRRSKHHVGPVDKCHKCARTQFWIHCLGDAIELNLCNGTVTANPRDGLPWSLLDGRPIARG